MRHSQGGGIFAVALEAWITLLLTQTRLLAFGKERMFVNLRILSDTEAGESLPGAAGEVEASGRRVKRALGAAARRLPWRSSCVVNSLAAARMLRRRRIPAVMFVGIRRGTGGAFEAHTWVRTGSVIVCGGGVDEGFTELARFALAPELDG